MATHVCVAALVMAILGAQAASPVLSDFRSADSARRLEILREIARKQTNLEISQFISLVREGLRDTSADVREGVLGIAIMRGMSAPWAGTSGPAMGPGPQPSPALPIIPGEWKGDEIRIRAELWDVFMSALKNDADDRVRHQALLAIGNLQMITRRDEALGPLLPLLVDLYRHDRSDEIRAEVVKAFRLERNTTAEMRAVLRDALVDTNASVRYEAQGVITAQALGAPTKLSFDEARDTIVAALQHADPRVRLGAVQALNIYGAPSAPHLATLERLSSADPDAQVRTSSRLAIEAIQRALRGQAPPAAAGVAQNDKMLERVRGLALEVLSGPITTYYSPDGRARAEAIQRRVRESVGVFENRYKVSSPPSLAVLNEAHWAALSKGPYGGMAASAAPHVVVLPAFPDRGALAQFFRAAHAKAVSSEAKRAWAAVDTTHDTAVAAVMDAMALHEVGHVFVNGALRFSWTQHWFNEFMATYMAQQFLREREPATIAMWKAVSLDVVNTVRPSIRTLDEFNAQYAGMRMGPETYAWFYSQITLGVAAVLDQQADQDWFGRLRAAGLDKDPSLSSTELVERLERITPGLKRWVEQLSGVAPLLVYGPRPRPQ